MSAPTKTVSLLSQTQITIAFIVLILGTLVTGSGPHAGDEKTQRFGFDIRSVAILHADAVILSTGGFQGNPDLTARYFGRWADRLVLRATPHSTGDGLLMGQAIGAATSRAMSSFYGHLIPAPPAVVPTSTSTSPCCIEAKSARLA